MTNVLADPVVEGRHDHWSECMASVSASHELYVGEGDKVASHMTLTAHHEHETENEEIGGKGATVMFALSGV